VTANDKPVTPPKKPRKPRGVRKPAPSGETGTPPQAKTEPPPLVGEYIAKEIAKDEEPGKAAAAESQAMAPVVAMLDPTDEKVVERVEHLNRGAGWTLITAGIVGLVVPGVLGTPFLIMGTLALWPGNRKKVERWRQGHSPKLFHGAMKQINRFLDDLEKRYPRIDRQ
jgi:hypothetical protein